MPIAILHPFSGISGDMTLGALVAVAPHSRQFPVTGSATNPDLARRLRLGNPSYEGPTGVVGTLHELDKAALVQILTQPRNAITRQYQKLFEYENVKLRFADDALEAIAESALERKIGARGLRMIIEDLMLDLMYSLPNQKKVRECVITREVVEAKDKPITLVEKAG